MIPTWLKLSSIVCSSAGDTLSCAGRPTGPGISSLTYTTTSGHHRRYLPDFPEITGQSFRNPHRLSDCHIVGGTGYGPRDCVCQLLAGPLVRSAVAKTG